jgi:Protein of unknown function (DUF998)
MTQLQGQQHENRGLRLLVGMAIVGVIFSILLEVFIQVLPPHYSPISQSESSLAVGPYGYLMAINFVIRGLATFLFIAAFVRIVPRAGQSRSGLILLGISGVEKLIIAVATTDLTPHPETVHGTIHALTALSGFFLEALGALLVARGLRHVPQWSPSQRRLVGLASAALIWSLVVIVTVAVSTQIGVWGLFERILTVLLLLWIYLVSLQLWRASDSSRNQLLPSSSYGYEEAVSRR